MSITKVVRTRTFEDPQTTEEAAAGIVPSDTSYEPGDVRRYGAVADSALDTAGTDCLTAFQNAVDSGHPVYVPSGWYNLNGTLVIGAGSSTSVQGGLSFKMESDTRLERFDAANGDPLIQIVNYQNHIDFGGGVLADRASTVGHTRGLLLVGVDPTMTDNNDSTCGDMEGNIIENVKIIGKLANTGWNGSIGMMVNAASRRRGVWKTGGTSCNVYYNRFSNITMTQWDWPLHVSSEASFNTFDKIFVHNWGHAAIACMGYGNHFIGFWNEKPSPQDTTERYVIYCGEVNDSFVPNEAVNGTNSAATVDASITAITKANPANITTGAAHGLITGDYIHIDGIVDSGPDGDMEGLLNNGRFQVTVIDPTNFTIPVDTSGLTQSYSSGGDIKTDHLGTMSARSNYFNGSAESAYDASTKVTRLFGYSTPNGAFDSLTSFNSIHNENTIDMQGSHPGGIGIGGNSTPTGIGRNTVRTNAVDAIRHKPVDFGAFRFDELDDASSGTFGTDHYKVFSGRMPSMAESTAYNVVEIDNVGATCAGVMFKLEFMGKMSANQELHCGEISWLCPVIGGTAQTPTKYKDFQASDTQEWMTWSVTAAAGTDANTGKFTLVATTGSAPGTEDFYYTWRLTILHSNLEGTNLDWLDDVTVINGGL